MFRVSETLVETMAMQSWSALTDPSFLPGQRLARSVALIGTHQRYIELLALLHSRGALGRLDDRRCRHSSHDTNVLQVCNYSNNLWILSTAAFFSR